jgi:3-hydroxyacyl-[acyl-carrier-protein] dehydratase
VPGDRLELRARISKMSARAGKGSGQALVNGEIACECELLFVVVDA